MRMTNSGSGGPSPPIKKKRKKAAGLGPAARKSYPHPQKKRGSPKKSSGEPFAAPLPNSRPAQKRRTAVNPAKDRETALREQARRRKQRIRRRQFFLYSVILLLVAGIGVSLSLTVFFHIETIAVEGNSRYQAQDILNKIEIKTQDNLFLSNTKKAETAILDAFPYIKEVKIKRALPSRLVITVMETSAAFVVEEKGTFTLLDPDGQVLETGLANAPAGLPVITGVEFTGTSIGEQAQFRDESTAETMRKVMAAVDACGIRRADYIGDTTPLSEQGNIEEVNLSNMLNIQLLFDGRLNLELGTPTDLEYKLQFAKTAIDKLAEDARGTLDLSILKKATYSPEKTQPPTTEEPSQEDVPQEE